MPRLEFKQPQRAPVLPFPARVRPLARILLYRSIPLKWALSLACFLRRFEMRTHPQRKERISTLLKPLLPKGTTSRGLWRRVLLSRAIRRLGGHTYSPVFRRSRSWLLRTFQPQGLDTLEKVRLAGRGAIILGTHAGMNAWIGPILTQLGYPVRPMQRKTISPEKLFLLHADGSIRQAVPYPVPGEEGLHLKRLHDMLRQGHWIQHVASYPDHQSGLVGNVLGGQIRCCRAPWVLSRLTGAPLIPVLALLDERLQGRLYIGSPIYVDDGADLAKSMQSAFQSYLDFVGSKLTSIPWNLSFLDWQTLTPVP